MSERRWSLVSRLRLGFALGSLVLVLLPAGVNAWFVAAQAEREVVALLGEELDELGVYLDLGHASDADLEQAVSTLRAEHTEVGLAFRVWRPGSTEPLHLGAPGLVDRLVGLPPPLGVESLGASVRRASEERGGGGRVECAIDARGLFERTRRLQIGIGVVALGATVVALGVAELLSRRAVGLLHRVALGVRRHPSVRTPLDVGLVDPPDEIREVVEALERLVERARAEDERTRLLVSSMAHELRAPIQNIVLEGEVALMGGHTLDDYRRVVEDQVELARGLADSVDNLVSLCRSDSPSDAGARERFDVGEEAALRSERWQRTAARRGVELVLRRAGDLSLVGDREAAMRALRNLVANAIEWTATGTAVEVELEGGDEAVELRVHDRGPGVAERDRERAFEPFVRLDADAERRAGYGLGLSIVRRGAEAFGGTARLEPRPGGGTTAVLRLPRSREPVPSP